MSEFSETIKKQQEEYEAHQNLVGFFALLFEVDMRNNPHLYQRNENNGNTNNANQA